jgi:membrane fusion protein, multidrug efflux system
MDTMVQRTRRPRSTTFRMIIMLVAVVVVLGFVFAWPILKYMIGGAGGGGMGGGAPVVSTIVTRYEEWQPHLQVVGSLRAVNGADLAFETPGVVEKVYFDAGGDVAKGTPLVALRAADDIARLHTLQAAANLAATTYARAQKLFSINGISRQQLEQDAAALRSAQAQVAEQQAVIAKKVLRAPFAGHLGLRRVNVGEYVNAGVPVVTLQMLDPIFLDFTVPQQKLSQLEIGQSVNAQFDAYPGVAFSGTITSIDPKADQETRNVAVRATFPNADRKLVPGMFATAQIAVGQPQRYLTLPQTAVTFNPYGSTAYVVEQQKSPGGGPAQLVARQNFITTGDTRGDQIQILSGLKEGEIVVTSGQIKLQNGSPVAINNAIHPTNNPNPTPIEQ